MKNKKGVNKSLILIIGALLLISLIVIVSALTDNERQALNDELNNLTSQLNDNGYSWLINLNSIEIHNTMYLST